VGVPISVESEREMRRMSETSDAPEVLAVAAEPLTTDLQTLMEREGLVLVLVGLRYPGNVGFILRSAEVAGAAGVVVANDWSDSEWEEAHRVGIRANRFLSVIAAEAEEAVFAARTAGRRVVAVETSGTSKPWEVDLSEPAVLLIGGEATGISAELLANANEVVRIPTRGFIPSYNVQAATGMLLGEWLRKISLSEL
jgi:TrmH family RNA methyltransferase